MGFAIQSLRYSFPLKFALFVSELLGSQPTLILSNSGEGVWPSEDSS